MRRIFTFFLTFLLGVFVTALYAQTHTVSGTVIDKDANEPLIGANVLIKEEFYKLKYCSTVVYMVPRA
ncbi:hypothetical protein [Phocaeicola vulgatus]|uniref:hypothetical protein n=1 Tax=Phocaeicola vulgatus TaxID=821 RepID=UPI0035615FA2